MGYYIGEIIKLRNKFFEASDKADFAEAVKLGKDIIKLYKDNNDCESLEYANDLNNLAITFDNVMNHQKAVELYRQAADIIGRIEGENSLAYADTLSNMAVALSLDDKHTEAFSYHRKALKIRESQLDENDDDCIMSLYNLGSACEDLEKNDRALQYYDSALKRAESRTDYPKEDYADIVIGCARIYALKGRYKKSIEFYSKAINILNDISKEKNFFYLTTLTDAAAVCEKSRVYSKAAYFYQMAVDVRKNLMDKAHLDYITNLSALANVYNKMGNHKRAVELHKEVISLIKRLIGSEHPFYADGLNSIAIDYMQEKDYEKALEYNGKASEFKKQVSGTSTPGFALITETAGDIYKEMGNFKAAEEKYQLSAMIRKQALGENDALYISSVMKLGGLYKKQGLYSKAAEEYYNALRLRKDSSSHENIGVSVNLYELADLMIKMGKNGDALSFAQKAADIRRLVYGKLHPRYFRGLYYLGLIQNEAGKFKEACENLTEAMKYQREYLGEESSDYKDTRKVFFKSCFDLSAFYFSSGDSTKAMECYESVYAQALKEGAVDKNQNNIRFAPLFASVGNTKKAEEMLEEYRQYAVSEKGEYSKEYAGYLKEQGKLLIGKGNVEEAEKILVKCLETEFVVNKKENTSSDEVSVILGDAFRKKGEMKKAYSYYEKVIQNTESEMFPKAAYGISSFYTENGESQKAKEILLKAKNAMEKSGKFENRLYADTAWNLGVIYEKEKNYSEAERMYNVSVCTRRLLKDNSVKYLNDLMRLGNIMKRNSNKAEAASAYNEAAMLLLKLKGEKAEYAKLITKLAKLYVDLGKNEAAENFFKKAADIYKNLYGDDSDEYAMALYDQLLFCVKSGKAVQAADSLQSLMSVVEKNIYSRFRNEKYDLRLKKLYEKIQKM